MYCLSPLNPQIQFIFYRPETEESALMIIIPVPISEKKNK